MLDSAAQNIPIAIPESYLTPPWTKITVQRSGHSPKITWKYVEHIGSCSIELAYYPVSYTGGPLLSVSFSSLAKLVYGTSLEMLTDMDLAVSAAQKSLDRIPYIPKLDISKGILHRLDLCYNHVVGDLVYPYLKGISLLSYPRMHRAAHSNYSPRVRNAHDNGVLFHNQQRSLKFYHPYPKDPSPQAYGLLRQEVCLKETGEIATVLGREKPTLLDITPKAAENVLNEELGVLGLDRCFIAGPDIVSSYLRENFNGGLRSRLKDLFQLIADNPGISKKELTEELGVTTRTINRWFKAILATGIVPAYIGPGEMLPPLQVKL
jgi:hypothetical protein